MAQITALINWENINLDIHNTAIHKALINPWVISGLAVTTGQVAVGEAFVECTRSNGEKIMVHFQNTSVLNIDTSGNKKIFVEIKQANIDNGIINAEDGSNIGEIKSADSYPSKNYIPLASITGGNITDAREIITLKNISRKWLTGNGFLVVENGQEKVIPDLPSTALENIKNLTKEEITKVSKENNFFYEGVIREEIPMTLTPLTYHETWEYILTYTIDYQTITINLEWGFTVDNITYSEKGTTYSYSGSPTFVITPYNEWWQALNAVRKWTWSHSAQGINVTSHNKAVINIENFNNSYYYHVHVKVQREAGFYKMKFNKGDSRLVGFAFQNKKWDRLSMIDIAHANVIDFPVSANGEYGINQDMNVSLWSGIKHVNRNLIFLWNVKNQKLEVNLRNVGLYTTESYIHFAVEKERNHNSEKLPVLNIVKNSFTKWIFA